MILLDTNVLSELMKPRPNGHVLSWLDNQSESDVWTSSITVAEIYLGIAFLDDGRKKSILYTLAKKMFEEDFIGRCLPFDTQAASEYATIVSHTAKIGRPISVEDAQIAAISISADLSLATRNTKDFNAINGLAVVNPWIA